MLIRTANDQEIIRKRGGYRRFVEFSTLTHWGEKLPRNWDDLNGQVMAQVARSNWYVSCPFCVGALMAEPGEPFFCVDCLMQANAFRPMLVMWPENRLQIERVLILRPDPLTRNWLPLTGETLETLMQENQAHGHRVI